MTDLLERPLTDEPELTITADRVTLALRPFQIVTVRLLPRAGGGRIA